jgi:heterodisulfide reductase subunit A2
MIDHDWEKVMTTSPRIGVYICHCGINIAATVDVQAVSNYAAHLPGVQVARNYSYMCSSPGQELIKNDIANLNLNRVVVASCSPLMHEPTFRAVIAEAGLNAYCLEMANIREQCSWVHAGDISTTQKAMQLVVSAVAKASRLEALAEQQAPVIPVAVVIGGGVAGMQAGLDLADAGFKVRLVEQAKQLGGHAAQLSLTFPSLESATDLVRELVEKVSNHPRIEVKLETQVIDLGGFVGNFRLRVQQGLETDEICAGVILVATGFDLFDPHRKPELGYGVYPQVITTMDFERMLQEPEKLPDLKSVAFIQCVGSRDKTVGKPYCSRVCCMVTAKQAWLLRQRMPETSVTVFYMDIRAFGKGYEEFYDSAREDGVIYRRGSPSEILRQGERVMLRVEDTLLGESIEIPADLVVLAVGMGPNSSAGDLAAKLKLSRSADGFFMEAHPKLRPVDTHLAGIYLAGCCQGPKDITDTITQARAAAASAMIPLRRGSVKVEPMTSFIQEEICAGCGQCASVCSFGALTRHPLRKVMTLNPVLCQGCGACAAVCPSGAINVHQFTFDQVLAQVEALSNWQYSSVENGLLPERR